MWRSLFSSLLSQGESFSYYRLLDRFRQRPQLSRRVRNPKELGKPPRGVLRGAKIRSAITVFSMQNSMSQPTGEEATEHPARPAALHLFSCRFCGRWFCARRNESLCVNVTVEQGQISSSLSESVPFPFSPVLQFPLALETDICYFQFHNFLVRCIAAHMAQELQI